MRVDRDSSIPTNGQHTPDHRFPEDGSCTNATDDLEQGERTIPRRTKTTTQAVPRARRILLVLCDRQGRQREAFLAPRSCCGWYSPRLGFVAVAGLIVIASWLMLSGIAEGLGGFFGNRLWAGSLMTGFLLLAGLGLGMHYAIAKRNRTANERAAQKYESRQARQQAEFGRNVAVRRQLLPLIRSERSFLADQAADAKSAMTGTLHDMKDTLTRVAEVPSCAKQHPWLVVGCAVAAWVCHGRVC